MVSSDAILPVIGVPIQSRALQGLDSLLSRSALAAHHKYHANLSNLEFPL